MSDPDNNTTKQRRPFAVIVSLIHFPLLLTLLLLFWLLSTCTHGSSGYAINSNLLQVDDPKIFDSLSAPGSQVAFEGEVLPTAECFIRDLKVDGGDGPGEGKVRWFICPGIDCDELKWQ